MKWKIVVAALTGLFVTPHAAWAVDTIRVGKSVPIAWTFTPLDIGVETGIWAKHDLKLDITSFGGDAKLQQALAANGVDFGLGSGPGMGFAVKGVPAKAVAAFAGSPYSISIVIPPNAPYNDIKEMKGKKFAVTTIGSLTEWLLHRAALAQGWKYNDLVAVPLGSFETNYAAFKTGQVDGIVLATETSYMLEARRRRKSSPTWAPMRPSFIPTSSTPATS